MYEELVYKLRHCNLYGEEPLHWVRIICDAAEAIEKLQSELEHLKNCRHECKIDCLLKEYNKKCNELEQVKAERDAAIKDMKNNNKCSICLFRQVPSNKCPYYNKCGLTYEYFQWRGPQD